jgi:hypothetical protein
MEVMEAAYDISCPDSTCDKQGILALQEIESLVSTDLMEKHRKFRLDKGKKIYFLDQISIFASFSFYHKWNYQMQLQFSFLKFPEIPRIYFERVSIGY